MRRKANKDVTNNESGKWFIGRVLVMPLFRFKNNLLPNIDITLSAFNESDKPVLKQQRVFEAMNPWLSELQ
jgi:hypothetical protein